MAWTFLIAAGFFEVAATTVFRLTDGLSRLGPVLVLIALGIASFYCLNRSISGPGAIPIGTAYAVWTGIGAAGTAILGVMYYGEPAGTARLVLIVMLVGSIIGLKLVAAD